MDFNSLRSVLASSKEKVDEMLAPVRIRQVRAKADLEISKLEEKLITTERKIVESVAKKDIDVSVHEGVITIRGERRMENRASDEKHHRIESFYGSFARSFTLPADVDETKIHAESKDGVLTVRLPKTEARKPRPIEVQVR